MKLAVLSIATTGSAAAAAAIAIMSPTPPRPDIDMPAVVLTTGESFLDITSTPSADTAGTMLTQAAIIFGQDNPFQQLFSPDNGKGTFADYVQALDQELFHVGQVLPQGYLENIGAALPETDQTNAVLLDAAQGLLSADQALFNADTTGQGLLAADLAVQQADLTLGNAVLDALLGFDPATAVGSVFLP